MFKVSLLFKFKRKAKSNRKIKINCPLFGGRRQSPNSKVSALPWPARDPFLLSLSLSLKLLLFLQPSPTSLSPSMSSSSGYVRSSQRASISPLRSRKSPAGPAKPAGRPTTPSSSSTSSRPSTKASISSVAAAAVLDLSKAKENVSVTVRFRPLRFVHFAPLLFVV